MMQNNPPPAVRILHLDDEREIAELVSVHVEQLGDDVIVTSFTSPTDALDRFGPGTFDCIVSDFDMPEMDGLSFLRAVRAVDPTVPFILFTGQGGETLERRARRQGATTYLRKGGADSFTTLRAQIRSVVGLRASPTDTQ